MPVSTVSTSSLLPAGFAPLEGGRFEDAAELSGVWDVSVAKCLMLKSTFLVQAVDAVKRTVGEWLVRRGWTRHKFEDPIAEIKLEGPCRPAMVVFNTISIRSYRNWCHYVEFSMYRLP